MSNKRLPNVLRLNEMTTAIEKLTKLLSGRCFDFKYVRASKEDPDFFVENQRLSFASCLNPVRLEKRGINNYRKECLVFVVEGEDDLWVSVSDWLSELDIEIIDDKNIVIKNHEGDKCEINIHSGK